MENVFLTSLTTPEVKQLFRQELENFFQEKAFLNSTEPRIEENERFTISELADYLKCTKATIHAYKKRGVFPYYQTGRTVYFIKSEIDEALAATKSNKRKKNI
ncbi:helix-turn-helix domain-containing protein [Daejeonella sp. H1SJ63]|uniref:helix-turn-helix domain-containing protein n=1 Tax=Daejeonella sp. H1SJ63 TaxID=3034145 RepID=UPI0023ECCC95|nr:helix-turn-helix domain-containing protein [Daejeonella sp. H1SJ63]